MFPETTNIAQSVDGAFLFIGGISVVLLLGITLSTIFFIIRYNWRRNADSTDIAGSIVLETIWTVVPTVLVLLMFWYGYKGFELMRTAPGEPMIVKATGRMWSWQFEYENGVVSDVLHVPEDRVVKLLLGSEDVIHSLFIPAFRVKEDVVPGQQTSLWFQAEEVGSFDIFCTEYCGTGHSDMITTVEVDEPEIFEKWLLARKEAKEGGLSGEEIFNQKGCNGCHSLDGSRKVGPTLKGIWQKQVKLSSGETVTADEQYIRNSILNPGDQVVEGFPNVMQPQGDKLSEEELETLIEFLKDPETARAEAAERRKGPEEPGHREAEETAAHERREAELGMEEEAEEEPAGGKALLESKGCLICHSLDGTRKVGPTFKGIWQKEVKLSSGETVTADEQYIRDSILTPSDQVVEGFPDVMQPQGDNLTEGELKSIVEFLKTSGKAEKEKPEPEKAKEMPEKEKEREAAAAPAPAPDTTPAQAGLRGRALEILRSNGCTGCHTLDGSESMGPTFKGLWEKEVTLEGGGKTTADAEYIKRAIQDPGAEVVQGYPSAMPPGNLGEGELDTLVEFFRTGVAPPEGGAADLARELLEGKYSDVKELFEERACLLCHSLDGSRMLGPTFKGLWGRKVKLESGRTVTAGADYIRTALLYPSREITAGYPDLMPHQRTALTSSQAGRIAAFLGAMASKEKAPEAEEAKPEPAKERKEAEAGRPEKPEPEKAEAEPELSGRNLLDEKGCLKCHTLDGSKRVGPTYKGLWQSRVTLSSGETVTVDEEYLRESILSPGAKIVEGFSDIMPPRGGSEISEKELDAIIEFLKTTGAERKPASAGSEKAREPESEKPEPEKPEPELSGRNLVEEKGCLKCHTLDGSRKVGPTFEGRWKKRITLSSGETITVDEEYLRESILSPGAKIVKGYSDIMPPRGGSEISEKELDAIIEFLKTQ